MVASGTFRLWGADSMCKYSVTGNGALGTAAPHLSATSERRSELHKEDIQGSFLTLSLEPCRLAMPASKVRTRAPKDQYP